MGDIFLDRPLDRQMIQDRKMAKLQAEIAAVESRMSENAALQRHLESINDAERERSQRVIDKMHGRNNVLKDEIDRFYQTKSPVLSPSLFSLGVNDVIARRTKEFSQLQHEKALQYKYLMAEKQRLQVAQEKLREKRMAMHRMPTPEGKMTWRYWGNKYDIYTPLSMHSYSDVYTPRSLPYDSYFEVQSPVFEKGYFTHYPTDYFRLRDRYPEEEFVRKRREQEKKRILYVPRPLYQSNLW